MFRFPKLTLTARSNVPLLDPTIPLEFNFIVTESAVHERGLYGNDQLWKYNTYNVGKVVSSH